MIARLGQSDRLLILKKPFDPIEVRQLAAAMTQKWNATRRERQRLEDVRRAEMESRAYAASLLTVNRALEAAKASSEAAAQLKSEFLLNMSQEIRPPVAAIVSCAGRLRQKGQGPEADLEPVDEIRRRSVQVLGVLDDILDIAKMEAGRMEIDCEPCSPVGILDEVVARLRPLADQKGLSLIAEAPERVPETIRSDPARLRQILTNLVRNAIKFTDSGSVDVSVGLERSVEWNEPRLRFTIQDTGVGISAAQQTMLFEAFAQAEGREERKQGGAGLGLVVTKRLCQMLGGDIRYESTPGVGSRFTVTVRTGDLTGVRMVGHPQGVLPSGAQPTASSALDAGEPRAALPAHPVDGEPIVQTLHSEDPG
jgi:signal transduction histidine kinase